MSKYTYRIMHLPIKRYLKWWLDKFVEAKEQIFIGISETNPAYLTDCLRKAFLKFVIKGKTEQGENVEGKNLLNIPNFTETAIQGINISASNQQLKINGTGTSGNYPWIIITKGGIYLKNGTPTSSEIIGWANGTISEGIVSKSKEIISGSSDFNIEIDLYDETGTTISSFTSSTKVVAMALYLGNNKTYTNYTLGLQIEKGSTVTFYVPYNCIQIKKCNKNIFDGELELGIYSGSTGNKSPNNNYVRCTNFQPVDELTDYKFSKNGEPIDLYVYEYKADYSYNQSASKLVNHTQHLTTNEGTAFITFRTYSQTTDTSMKIQMERGTTISDYVIHQEKTYNFPLLEGQSLSENDYIDKKRNTFNRIN